MEERYGSSEIWSDALLYIIPEVYYSFACKGRQERSYDGDLQWGVMIGSYDWEL